MRTILKNGRVLTPIREIKKGSVVIEDGKIAHVITGQNIPGRSGDQVVDLKGNYLVPGFIDIHTHGGGGHDFMDGTVEAIHQGVKAHLMHGTTTIVPTTATSTLEELFETLDIFKKAKEELKNGPDIHGLHLEGPYFSMEQRGAQDARYIKNPDREEYLKILEYSDDIIRWTVAPELEGALEMGRELKKRGIIASIGHTNAIYQEVQQAFENGYSLVTHLYSGMSTVRRINAYRYAGVVEASYLLDELNVEIIADGVHLPESLLKLIYRIKGSDKICLVTDSMRAAGMPEGEYLMGSLRNGQKVIVEDGVAKLPDRTAFAGSVATADRLLKTMNRIGGVPLIEAVKMLTLTPARVLGIEKTKGSISAGKDADLVVLDSDIRVKMVIVKGNISYQEGEI